MSWSEKQKALYQALRDKEKTIDDLVEMGMIPKNQLEDRAYYFGICRNSTVAQWIKKPGFNGKMVNKQTKPCFFHMREKFGTIYLTTINHPEDEEFFDAFIPIRKIE